APPGSAAAQETPSLFAEEDGGGSAPTDAEPDASTAPTRRRGGEDRDWSKQSPAVRGGPVVGAAFVGEAEAVAAAGSAEARAVAVDPALYETIRSMDRLDHWIAEGVETGRIAFRAVTPSADP